MTTKQPLLAYFGHHKCASTWIEDISRSVCDDLGLRFRITYTSDEFGHDLPGLLGREKIDFLAYANADYRHVCSVPEVKGFHVVRDPRDIVVSAYFSHLNSHPTHAWPELVSHRAKLQAASKDEGLLLEMDFRAGQFAEMEAWPKESPSHILRLRMEDLTADPYNRVLEIFSFLDLLDEREYTASKRTRFFVSKVGAKIRSTTGLRLVPSLPRLPAERLLGILWENEFTRKSGGRAKGEEDVTSHYRKGTPGDWLNHFKHRHLEYFSERYSGLLLKYGYETDTDWQRKYYDEALKDWNA
jgi:hypothetical protein